MSSLKNHELDPQEDKQVKEEDSSVQGSDYGEDTENVQSSSCNDTNSSHKSVKVQTSQYEEKINKMRKIEKEIKIDYAYLQKHNIFYSPINAQNNLIISVTNTFENGQIISLSVSFSHFMMDITILNLLEKSTSQKNLKLLGYGTFSRVYLAEDLKRGKYAIKSISYALQEDENKLSGPKLQKLQKNLHKIIIQYSFTKLFSALKIGAKVLDFLGFDIILYADTAQFSIQYCLPPRNKDFGKDLTEILNQMHNLQIIHGDIKPDNVMWSTEYNKNVFIDFGLTSLLDEKKGEKTFTKYFGTYGYCNDQMRMLFEKQRMGFVDLYDNDLCGLKKMLSLGPDFKTSKISQDTTAKDMKGFEIVLKNFLIINYLYQQNFSQLQQLLNENKTLNILDYTVQFLECLMGKQNKSDVARNILERYSITSIQENNQFRNQFKQQRRYQRVSRIKEILHHYTGGVNLHTLFFLIFYQIDISVFSRYRLQLIMKKIDLLEPENFHPEGWSYFVEIIRNVYVTKSQLRKFFSIVKKKIGLSKWEPWGDDYFEFFSKTRQIVTYAYQKYKIGLYDLVLVWQKDMREHIIKTVKNIIPFFSFHKWENQIIMFYLQIQLNEKQKHTLNQNIFYTQVHKQLKNTVEEVLKKYNKKEEQLTELIQLITLGSFVRQLVGRDQYHTLIDQFLNKFKNIQPAKKSLPILKIKRAIMRNKESFRIPQQIAKIEKQFYRQSFSFLLDLQTIFKMIMMQKLNFQWKNPQKIDYFIKNDLVSYFQFLKDSQCAITNMQRFFIFHEFYFRFFFIYKRNFSSQYQEIFFNLCQKFYREKEVSKNALISTMILKIICSANTNVITLAKKEFIILVVKNILIKMYQGSLYMAIDAFDTVYITFMRFHFFEYLCSLFHLMKKFYQQNEQNPNDLQKVRQCRSKKYILGIIKYIHISCLFSFNSPTILDKFKSLFFQEQRRKYYFNQLAIVSSSIALYYSLKDNKFEEYFNFLIKYGDFLYSYKQEQNFTNYVCFRVFLEQYKKTNVNNFSEILEIYQEKVSSFIKQNHENNLNDKPFLLIVLQFLIENVMIQNINLKMNKQQCLQKIKKLFRLAEPLYKGQYCFSKRIFQSMTRYLILQALSRLNLRLSPSRKKISLFLHLRNHFFHFSVLPSLDNFSGKPTQVIKTIEVKIQKMFLNKSQFAKGLEENSLNQSHSIYNKISQFRSPFVDSYFQQICLKFQPQKSNRL